MVLNVRRTEEDQHTETFAVVESPGKVMVRLSGCSGINETRALHPEVEQYVEGAVAVRRPDREDGVATFSVITPDGGRQTLYFTIGYRR